MVSNHENIVKMLGYDDINKSLILELCVESLSTLAIVFRMDPLSLKNTRIKIKAIRDIVCGLQHIHSKNMIHFDLKTSNVLYTLTSETEYVFKVSDFGVRPPIMHEYVLYNITYCFRHHESYSQTTIEL